MINAYMQGDGRIVADSLPQVGERIMVQDFGTAVVKSLTHNDYDNFIALTLDDSLLGEYTHTSKFRVWKGNQ